MVARGSRRRIDLHGACSERRSWTSRPRAAMSAPPSSFPSEPSTSSCTRATILFAAAIFRRPAGVTSITCARRSTAEGTRRARPADSSSSSVATIVVLSSRPARRAASACAPHSTRRRALHAPEERSRAAQRHRRVRSRARSGPESGASSDSRADTEDSPQTRPWSRRVGLQQETFESDVSTKVGGSEDYPVSGLSRPRAAAPSGAQSRHTIGTVLARTTSCSVTQSPRSSGHGDTGKEDRGRGAGPGDARGRGARRSQTGSNTATAAYGCSGWSQRPCWSSTSTLPRRATRSRRPGTMI